MKKIKLVTFHSAVNQGTVIQAYALQKTMEGMGFEVEVVDYRPRFMSEDYLRPGGARTLAKKTLQYLIFQSFIKKHLHLTKRVYRKYQDFVDHPIDADYVVCGSDQIWNLKITKGLDPVYFLDFPLNGAKKVAYAVSMGQKAVPEALAEQFHGSVSKIHEVAAREEFTREQLAAGGRKGSIPMALDPTLLPVQLTELLTEKGSAEPPYIALYYIENDEEIGKAALKLKKTLGFPIVNVSFSRFKEADKNELFLNPGEWLKRIQGAAIVCTNSFHGTALSIKMNKAFYVINARKEAGWPGNRMRELLASLGLSHRMVDASGELPEKKEELLRTDDFEKAMELLAQRQASSLYFLKQALSKNKGENHDETHSRRIPLRDAEPCVQRYAESDRVL